MKIKKDNILISICLAILIGYFLILFKVICLKYLSISDILPPFDRITYHRPYNLIPLDTIKFYLLSDTMPLLRRAGNLYGNIALFIPVGLLLPVVFPYARKIITLLIISIFLSSLLEGFQYTLGTGSADIDDVILNTLGGLSGYFIFLILKARFKSETKTIATSLILFFILFFTGGWFASIEFKLDLGFLTDNASTVEIKRTNAPNDTMMFIPVRNADMVGSLEELSGDTLKINEFKIIRENNVSGKEENIMIVMKDADQLSNPLSKIVVSENTFVIRKDVTQYSTTQFDVQYSISGLDSIPLKCDLHIWKAHPDAIHADTLCYRVVRKAECH